MNITSNLPKYAQTPIANYLETGDFKDHARDPIVDGSEIKEEYEVLQLQVDSFVNTDQTKRDRDSRVGKISTEDKLFGRVNGGFERSEDGKTLETYQVIGGEDEGAVLFFRDSPTGADMITVTSNPSPDEGVLHISHVDPRGHFDTSADGLSNNLEIASQKSSKSEIRPQVQEAIDL